MSTKLLVLATSTLFCLCVALAGGWHFGSPFGRTLDLHDLSPDEAQRLVGQYLEESPDVLRAAWFDPRIAYTLRPNAKLACWRDRFTSNEIGYRTKSVAKAPGTFRVVFLGDSWTFGMGVSERESFPVQFEALANQYAGSPQRIESWSLALPGYNTTNQLAALDAFFDQIRPDAVVCCPTSNDIEDSIGVSPQDNMIRRRRGDQQEMYAYPTPSCVDSYLVRSRWEDVFSRYEETGNRLGAMEVPFFLFFVASWNEAFVHQFATSSELKAPYAIVPEHLAQGKWRRPLKDLGHGTPQAYAAFARIAYSLVAPRFGWNPLPEVLRKKEGGNVEIHSEPPPGSWGEECFEFMRENVVDAYDFTPGSPTGARQCWSTVSWKTGAISSNPAILSIKRDVGSSLLHIHLRKAPQVEFIYPLDVVASIPSRSGGTRTRLRIPRGGSSRHVLNLELPQDIEPGAAIDLIIEASRNALDRDLVPISAFIERIEQE